MAKQYQSIGGVVNEPSDAQREYQTTTAVAQTSAIAAGTSALLKILQQHGAFLGSTH
jgi:hypothetical protein